MIDGDHNYYTVSEELRLVEAAAGGDLPLLLFHDVCWPHARRDDYFSPELVPADRRRPIAAGGGLHPDEPGIRFGALPYRSAAAREGGPGNGVLTAVEDFVAARDGPAAGGRPGVLRPRRRLGPRRAVGRRRRPPCWSRGPAARCSHGSRPTASTTWPRRTSSSSPPCRRSSAWRAATPCCSRLLESSAFGLAERLSRVRLRLGIGREHAAVSKAEIRRALAD